ncbi:hypothetical protein N8I77_004783 [Diaporthe amygdali]|uniref:Rhodopsin domain-containing protein n=1 Tax=Phomopsis amygdali TaxID=1214568 RepID=A0AAD9SN86_PHOAM|nr:hypothetical protein N8I77_004783 [Diaporthe amygdali]
MATADLELHEMASQQGAVPPPQGEVSDVQNPKDVLHTVNIGIMIVVLCLTTPLFALRMYVRSIVLRNMGSEEWSCLVAYYSYAASLCYSVASFATKLALLLLLVRVFNQFRKTTIFLWATIAFQVAFCIAITVVKIIICLPIPGVWDPSIPSRCLDRQASFIADTAVASISDLVILFPPIILTWSLTFSTMKKIRVMLMLGAGGLATATSFARLGLLLQKDSFNDATLNFTKFNLLGVSEISIGLICACLPSLSILMGKYRTEADPQADRYVFPSILRNPRRARSILTTATESDEATRDKSRNVRTTIVREETVEEAGQA